MALCRAGAAGSGTRQNKNEIKQRLNGKVTLVTGAARGIGEAIARAFAAGAQSVVLTDINDARGAVRLNEAAFEIAQA
jgi:NAD(P)-dependent dehydrogenase (short-subunit alcohol dehydrogenase family)